MIGSEWQGPDEEFCSGGDCPEARLVDGRVEIRESTRPDESARFTPSGWAAFVAAVKAGKYDLPDGVTE